MTRGPDESKLRSLVIEEAEPNVGKTSEHAPEAGAMRGATREVTVNVDPGVWGPAHLVTDKDDLSVLRGLRPTIGYSPAFQVPIIYATHPTPGMLYMFAYRDVVPFENERGFIPGLYGRPGAEYP